MSGFGSLRGAPLNISRCLGGGGDAATLVAALGAGLFTLHRPKSLFFFFTLHNIQLTPQKLSAWRKNHLGAPGAGVWPEDQVLHRGIYFFYFLRLLYKLMQLFVLCSGLRCPLQMDVLFKETHELPLHPLSFIFTLSTPYEYALFSISCYLLCF